MEDLYQLKFSVVVGPKKNDFLFFVYLKLTVTDFFREPKPAAFPSQFVFWAEYAPVLIRKTNAVNGRNSISDGDFVRLFPKAAATIGKPFF
jgi:hypothetical protein